MKSKTSSGTLKFQDPEIKIGIDAAKHSPSKAPMREPKTKPIMPTKDGKMQAGKDLMTNSIKAPKDEKMTASAKRKNLPKRKK